MLITDQLEKYKDEVYAKVRALFHVELEYLPACANFKESKKDVVRLLQACGRIPLFGEHNRSHAGHRTVMHRQTEDLSSFLFIIRKE